MEEKSNDPLTDHTESLLTVNEQDDIPQNPEAKMPLRGAISSLLACGMGTGIYNLPYRISQVGVIPFLLFLIMTGVCSHLGMDLIWRLMSRFEVNSFSDMCVKAYGPRFRKITEFCLIIYPWGITICFQVLFAEFVIQLLTDNFGLPFYQGDIGRQNGTFTDLGAWTRVGITIAAILINLTLILQKKIKVIEKVSNIGVISVVFNTFVIIFTFFIGFTLSISDKEQQITTDYEYHGVSGIQWGQIKWFNADGGEAALKMIMTFSSLVFCFVSHQLVFPIINELENPNDKRVNTIFMTVHTTEIIIYFFVGMTGYLLLLEAIVMSSIQTIPMSIGKLTTCFALFISVPLNIFPARQVAFKALELKNTTKNHVIISLVLSFSGCLIAIVFRKVNSYFGLLGGTAGMMICGAVPMICFVKLIGLQTWKDKLLAGFMVLTSILGMVGAILSAVYAS